VGFGATDDSGTATTGIVGSGPQASRISRFPSEERGGGHATGQRQVIRLRWLDTTADAITIHDGKGWPGGPKAAAALHEFPRIGEFVIPTPDGRLPIGPSFASNWAHDTTRSSRRSASRAGQGVPRPFRVFRVFRAHLLDCRA